ncbi:MAG: DUF6308 family protein [Anaerolineales bacterium]
MKLVLGARRNDRIIHNPDTLLIAYRNDMGCDYLDYKQVTPKGKVFPEDLAVTLAVNSQAGWRAFRSLKESAVSINLAKLPDMPLEETSESERKEVAQFIAGIARLPGFAASLATKLLHKKRPQLIPILDNQAIFGAYMNENWPQLPATSFSVKGEDWIGKALDWIFIDLRRSENTSAWKKLLAIEPTRTKIELFDSVWWMYFRKVQPVR